MVGTQVPFLQTTLLSKASKITSIKCSLPKQVAKNIFQLDGTYAFLSLIGLYFIEVTLIYKMENCGNDAMSVSKMDIGL